MKTTHIIQYIRYRWDPDLCQRTHLDTITAYVELEIDLDALAGLLGKRGAENRGRRATMAGGLVKCRCVDRSITESRPLPIRRDSAAR